MKRLADVGVFRKKLNGFERAAEVLPPPPTDEQQHVPRRLKELMRARELLQRGQKVRRRDLDTDEPKLRPGVPAAGVQSAQGSVREAALQPPKRQTQTQTQTQSEQQQQQQGKRKVKYLSRKQRLKKARREEARQMVEERMAPSDGPAFGEVADAPPELPVARMRPHAANAGNRLGRLFQQQMATAVAGPGASASKGDNRGSKKAVKKTHRRGGDDQLRAEMIARYRKLRGTQLAAALPPVTRPAS